MELGELVTIILGVGVGLSLGALGGGGSTLAVPILVFAAGMTAQHATTASLLVVGVAAAIGAVGHHRAGNVRLGAGAAFGAAGLLGSRIGTSINHRLPEHALLVAFALLILVVAAKMYRSVVEPTDEPPSTPVDGRSGGVAVLTHGPTLVTAPERTAIDLSTAGLVRLGLAASAVGLLTGLFGVGGGFAVVPALTLLLGFGAREAIGTSLVVITINAAIALGMRAGSLDLDWAVVVPFLATVTAGVMVGSRVACRLDADRLTRSFAVMLALVAVYTGVGAVL